MSSGLPVALRLALGLQRVTGKLERMARDLTRVVALRAVPRDRRDSVTSAIYDRQPIYLPGSPLFDSGLFDWEQRLIADERFPRSGKVLVGGAGGGRELSALAALGYEVCGFDPSPVLARHAEAAIGGRPGGVIARGSYQDLISESRGERTALAPVLGRGPFAAVVLGWGSFCHLLSREEQRTLLDAVRSLMPAASVVVSCYHPFERGHASRATSSRAGTRGDDHDVWFLPHSGYYRTVDALELRAIAAEAGYDVVVDGAEPYPHGLLVPRP